MSYTLGTLPTNAPATPAIRPISSTSLSKALFYKWAIIGPISVALSAFHGYRRNQSVGAAIGWGLLGGFFPILTPAIAFAQGFGKPKKVAAVSDYLCTNCSYVTPKYGR